MGSDDSYSLYSAFDIDKHKSKYVNYLEVMIEADGTVVYAVPSHQEKAVSLACEKLGVSRMELEAMCPQEYWCDYLRWLLMISGAIAVWDAFCVACTVTKKQVNTLKRLKMAGIYKGAIPFISGENGGK